MLENLLVVKSGSSSNFDFGENRINTGFISGLSKEVAELYDKGTNIIIVRSGAVPIGMRTYGFEEKPKDIVDLQTCAADGEPKLVRVYQRFLEENGLHGGQVLVTYGQLNNKYRAQKLSNNLENMLRKRTVPLINYDDANDNKEVRSDNDRVSLYVAKITHAKRLVLLTDVDGLKDKEGNLIKEIRDDPLKYSYLCTGANSVSGGGMGMKLKIGADAQQLGITTHI